MTETPKPEHFKGKEPLEHVAETQAKGIIASREVHGTEIPGHLSAGADAARETAIILLVLWLILVQTVETFEAMCIFSLGWLLWKTGRSAWLAWFRLERMHRIVEQEHWEIKHHRPQEKEELKELYQAKGFSGKLLDDVVEVLMADEDRLLRVMVEEELCLTLRTFEHPLKQALGAALGTGIVIVFCLLSLYCLPSYGLWGSSFIALAAGAALAAYFEGNRLIPAIVWNLGLGALTSGSVYFLLDLGGK